MPHDCNKKMCFCTHNLYENKQEISQHKQNYKGNKTKRKRVNLTFYLAKHVDFIS